MCKALVRRIMVVKVFIYCAKGERYGIGEMAQQLSALVFAEDLGLFPSIHMVSHNHS